MTTTISFILAILLLVTVAVSTFAVRRLAQERDTMRSAYYRTVRAAYDPTAAGKATVERIGKSAQVTRTTEEGSRIVLKSYSTEDADYNRLCAEELAEMINQEA